MRKWDAAGYLSAWQTQAELFRIAVSDADLERPVPSCPEWTLGELVAHMAWANRRIGHRVRTTVEASGEEWEGPSGEPMEQLARTHAELLDILKGRSLDEPAWNPAPLPNTARFWFRRIACETAVHRWDAQMAIGMSEPIDLDLAVQGIEEGLDFLLPINRGKQPDAPSGLVHLLAQDADRQWHLRLRDQRVSVLDSDSVDPRAGGPDGRAAGSASDVLLALWGRVPFGILDVAGDLDLVKSLKLT